MWNCKLIDHKTWKIKLRWDKSLPSPSHMSFRLSFVKLDRMTTSMFHHGLSPKLLAHLQRVASFSFAGSLPENQIGPLAHDESLGFHVLFLQNRSHPGQMGHRRDHVQDFRRFAFTNDRCHFDKLGQQDKKDYYGFILHVWNVREEKMIFSSSFTSFISPSASSTCFWWPLIEFCIRELLCKFFYQLHWILLCLFCVMWVDLVLAIILVNYWMNI